MKKATLVETCRMLSDLERRMNDRLLRIEQTLYGIPRMTALQQAALGGMAQATLYGTGAWKAPLPVDGLTQRVAALEDKLADRCKACKQKLPRKDTT